MEHGWAWGPTRCGIRYSTKKTHGGVTKYLVLNANGLLKQKYYRKGLKLSQLLSTTPYNW